MNKSPINAQLIVIIIGLLALIASIISITIQARKPKRELTCQILASDELTYVTNIPNLDVVYTYSGKPIQHLWKLTLCVVNTGDQTIIGAGPEKMLIYDGIRLYFKQGIEILNIEKDTSILPLSFHVFPDSLQPYFEIYFDQWRINEKILFSLYMTATLSNEQPLFPIFKTRDIINGRVIIVDSRPTKTYFRKKIIEKLPESLSAFIKIIAYVTIIAMSVIFFILGWMDVSAIIKLKKWKKRNFVAFTSYLDRLSGISIDEKNQYKLDPLKLPMLLWSGFTGEKLSVTFVFTKSIILAVIIAIIFTIFVTCTFGFIIFISI